MKENKRLKEYISALPKIKEKVIAAALLLAISLTMIATVSFAWLVRSLSPELSGVSTTIAANGNLEIAFVGKRGKASGAPVDYSVATVNEALVIEVYEHLSYRSRAALVHRESLTGPIARGAELLELVYNSVAVVILPVPHALEELLAAEVVSRKSLVNAQALLDLDLRCNSGVVGAGNPKGRITLHTLGSYYYVLKGLVKRVSHVELARDVWRRYYY